MDHIRKYGPLIFRALVRAFIEEIASNRTTFIGGKLGFKHESVSVILIFITVERERAATGPNTGTESSFERV